ncbi:Mitochondrial import inner membrane translocase subunit tim8 [Blastocladiella emersonii ATCC 22665]|nr:Mitochondrial import inner membrane translocase subunit tim8 [Blastocladiella emersonii ATCC 22665]
MSSPLSAAAQQPQLDAASQAELQKFLEQENSKARVQSQIHTFTQMCWDKCITKVGNRLSSSEESCLTSCVERFLDTSIFIVKRLQDQQH